MTTLTSAVDAQVREGSPSQNYGQLTKLSVNGGGSSNDRYSYVAFPVLNVIPLNATIVSATLRLYLKGAWASTNNITVKRVTTPWKENTINWNNKPSVDATPTATLLVSAGVDKQELQLNVASILQEVANGGKFFGFRIELTEDQTRNLRSAEDPDATLRPQLDIEWTEAPEAPDRLIPDSQVVSSGQPYFQWQFTDRAGNTQQSALQVQVDDVTDFLTPTHDSGKVSSDLSEYVPGSSVITDGQTRYWRVRVWDGADLVSDWSDVAQFTRDDLGVLAISSPSGVTVGETTPPIVWTLTGETQESFRLRLFNITGSVPVLVHDSGKIFTSSTSYTIPPGIIVTGQSYSMTLDVWDTENRVALDHNIIIKQFTYVRDGTPAAVASLTATPTVGSPEVVLDFSRSVAPDFFALKVNGVEVEDRLDPADLLVSGTNYRYRYWLAKPRQTTTFEVEAVVQSGGAGTPFKHSSGNPTATAKTQPVGVWLADTDDSTSVQVFGKDQPELHLGENAATFSPIGAKVQVRIIDTVRGYEGQVEGLVLGASQRDAFNTLKSRRKELRLVIGDVAIPVTLEDGVAAPTPIPGDAAYVVSFSFFQSGPPWPVSWLT